MSSTVEPVPSLRQSYERMLEAAGEHAPALRRSLHLSVIAAACEGLAFACFYPLIAALLTEPVDAASAWGWLAAMAGLAALESLLRWHALQFAHTDTLAKVNYELRRRLGEQLRRMPLRALSQWRTGELGAILAGNVEQTVTPMSNLSAVLIRTLVVPVVAVGASFAIDWRLALAMALIVALAIPVYRWRRRLSGQELSDVAAAHARTEADVLEYVQGLPVLRAMSQTGKQAQTLRRSLEALRRLQIQEASKSFAPTLLFSSLVEVGLLLVLGLGILLVAANDPGGEPNGHSGLAALAALLVIAMRFSYPLSLFAGISAVFDYMEAGFKRIQALLSIAPLPVREPLQRPEEFDIRFTGVSFDYEDKEQDDEEGSPALRDLSFHLPEHSMTALVGPSGSGKTTITRLITRYADPRQGSVVIGGKDVRHMPPDELMRLISIVFQDVYLFNDTIAANIRMGKPQASDQEVLAAAEKANCHGFISRLPDGYDTKVGDIGGSLSGGERQRISIARAILKDAPIVILDEPTAALDTESEVMVQRAIDTLVKDRTLIVIAHRLSTVKGADQILVLDEGHLVEQGRHEQLLEKKGRYHAMWSAQQGDKVWH